MKNGRIAFQILVSIALVLSLVLPASIATTPANAASGLHGQQAAYGPEWSSPGVHDAPYSGGEGEDGVSSASGLAELSTESTEIAQIVGDTREVNCNILPRVFVVLYQDGVFVRAAISDESGAYVLAVPSLGDYEVVASKGGFRDETRTISVEEAATHIVDFRGDYGLIPNAPDVHYYAACARLLGRQAGPCRLDVSKVAAVRDAWKHPVSQETDHDPRNRLQQELQLTDEQLEQLETGTGTLQLTEEQVNILSDYVTQLLEDLEPWLDEAQWQEVKAILESMLTQGEIDLETLGPVAEAISAALDAMDEADSGVSVYTNLVRLPAGEATSPEGYGHISAAPQLSPVVIKYTPGDSGYGDRHFEQPRTIPPRTTGKGGESVAAVNHLDGSLGVYSEATLLGGVTTYALQRVLIHVPADDTDVSIKATLQYMSGTITGGVPPPINFGSTAITTVAPYKYSQHVRPEISNRVIDPWFTTEDGIRLTVFVVANAVSIIYPPLWFTITCLHTAIEAIWTGKDIHEFYSGLREYGEEEVVTYDAESLSAGDYYFELGLRARADATIGVASAYIVGLTPEIEVTMDVPTHTLTVTSTNGGRVTQPIEGTHTYWAGQKVGLAAEADDWYVFAGWTGDTASIANPASPSTTITMSDNYSVTAEFEALDPDALFAGGSGTEADPYRIANWYHLDNVRIGPWAHYMLIANLNSATVGYTELAGPAANDGQGWLPIGDADEPFTGTFDGQGQEIRDLFVYRPQDSRVGLFGYAGSGAGLKNTGIVSVDVTGKEYVGGLVGQSRGYVGNCYSGGTVSGESIVGGLVGRSHNTIGGSHATGSVSGNQRVGGLAGDNYSYGTVSNSHFSGVVDGGEYVGGLVGQNDGEIVSSHATGDVTAQFWAGGLVGYNTRTVSASHSDASTAGESLVGGLIGENTGAGSSVSNSYSTGAVTGQVRAGGLIGYNHWGTVSNTYAAGSVTGDRQVGGLIACNAWGKVSKSYSTGSVAGSQQVGGLVGWNYDGTVSSCFWDTATSGTGVSDGGTGKTTAEMQNIMTFSAADWDILAVAPGVINPAHIWNIVDGQTYPFLTFESGEDDGDTEDILYVPDDYPTIQAAVDAAGPGNTVIVREGTYIENVTVGAEKEYLTIRSEKGPGLTSVHAENPTGVVFHIGAMGVELSGFTVRGGSNGVHLVGVGSIVSDNRIHSNDGRGVRLFGGGGHTITTNEIVDNGGVGIHVQSSDNNSITMNTVSSNDGGGVWLDGGGWLPIPLGNRIYLNSFVDNHGGNFRGFLWDNLVNSPDEMRYIYDGNSYTSYLGNHWSDYPGTDNDGDGIGDTPHYLRPDTSLTDDYPLMQPYENYVIGTGLADSPWPKFRQNLQNTGRSPYTGPETLEPQWSFTTGGRVNSSPAIGADGTIYVGSNDENLYAINPDGSLKWSFTTVYGIGFSSPAIWADGTVYVASFLDGKLYAITPDGSEKWSFTTGGYVNSSPAIGADGTIYVGSYDENLYAINPDGSEKWSFTTGGMVSYSPAIGVDGTIYVGSRDNNLYAINPDGSLKWSFTTGGVVSSSPAIGADGTIYVGSSDSRLYAVNPDGSLKWSFTTGSMVSSSPAIGADGTIYVGSYDNRLYAINPDGTGKWSFTTGDRVYSSPAIGADGTIYVGSEDFNLYAIDADGNLRCSFTTAGYVYSSPAIGANGTVYVGSVDNRLYALGKGG